MNDDLERALAMRKLQDDLALFRRVLGIEEGWDITLEWLPSSRTSHGLLEYDTRKMKARIRISYQSTTDRPWTLVHELLHLKIEARTGQQIRHTRRYEQMLDDMARGIVTALAR